MDPLQSQYLRSYEEARPIFERHRGLTDPLSKSLFRWEIEVYSTCASILSSRFFSEGKKQAVLLENVRSLVCKLDTLLVAHVNGATLHSPYLSGRMKVFNFQKEKFIEVETQLTWNLDTLTAYTECLELDQKEGYEHIYLERQDIEVQIHEFAYEIIHWRNSLEMIHVRARAPQSSNSSEREMIRADLNEVLNFGDRSPQVVSLLLRLMSLGILSSLFIERSQEQERENVKETERLAAGREGRAMAKEDMRARQAEEQRQKEHAAKMKADMDDFARTQETDEARRRSNLDDLNTKTAEEKRKIEEARAANQKLAEEIARVAKEKQDAVERKLKSDREEVDRWYAERKAGEYGGIPHGLGIKCIIL